MSLVRDVRKQGGARRHAEVKEAEAMGFESRVRALWGWR